jgi:DNA repair protein RecN (Recombination protein N)
LGALAMEGATFEVALADREPGPTGVDGVEFLLGANSGVPPGPVRDIASGGELSRVMLALMGAAHGGESDGDPGGATLVFDEVDAGIGGHAARAVGEQLRALAGRRQVLCITHLPQVASLADRHFSITREPGSTPARAVVRELGEGDVVSELVRMLGSDAGDAAARRHASRLRRAA